MKKAFRIIAIITFFTITSYYAPSEKTVNAAELDNQPQETQEQVLFFDDFSKSGKWKLGGAVSRKDGELKVLMKKYRVWTYVFAPVKIENKTYSVETDTRFFEGIDGKYSIVFDAFEREDIKTYFTVDPFSKKYYLRKKFPGGWKTLINGTESEFIKPNNEINKMKVSCIGNMVKLYINGTLLTETNYEPNSEKDQLKVGLAVYSANSIPASVKFDNFKVTVP